MMKIASKFLLIIKATIAFDELRYWLDPIQL
jgi:hypothetical protein